MPKKNEVRHSVETALAQLQVCGARLVIEAADAGVVAVRFLGGQPQPDAPMSRDFVLPDDPAPRHEILQRAITEIGEYFSGRRREFTVPISFALAKSDFQRIVLEACARIPYGQTTTYGKLAAQITGSVRGGRAVGRALAANPLPILIPCHRVVRAGRSIGGFSWGREWKKFLRHLEANG